MDSPSPVNHDGPSTGGSHQDTPQIAATDNEATPDLNQADETTAYVRQVRSASLDGNHNLTTPARVSEMLAAISRLDLPDKFAALAKYRPAGHIPPYHGQAQTLFPAETPITQLPSSNAIASDLPPEWPAYAHFYHQQIQWNGDIPPKDSPFHIQFGTWVFRWGVWIQSIEDPDRREELREAVLAKMESVWLHGIDSGLFPRFEEQARAAGVLEEIGRQGSPLEAEENREEIAPAATATGTPIAAEDDSAARVAMVTPTGKPIAANGNSAPRLAAATRTGRPIAAGEDGEVVAATPTRKQRRIEAQGTWLFSDGLSTKPFRMKTRDKSTRVLVREIEYAGVSLENVKQRVVAEDLDAGEALLTSTLENLGGDIEVKHWAAKVDKDLANPLGRDLLVYALHEVQVARHDKIELARLMRRFHKDAQKSNTMARIDEAHVREQNFLALALELDTVKKRNAIDSHPSAVRSNRTIDARQCENNINHHHQIMNVGVQAFGPAPPPPFVPVRAEANLIYAARRMLLAEATVHGMMEGFLKQGLVGETIAGGWIGAGQQHPLMATFRDRLHEMFSLLDRAWDLDYYADKMPDSVQKRQLRVQVEILLRRTDPVKMRVAQDVADLTAWIDPQYLQVDPRKTWPFPDPVVHPAYGRARHDSAASPDHDVVMGNAGSAATPDHRSSSKTNNHNGKAPRSSSANQSNNTDSSPRKRRRRSRQTIAAPKTTPSTKNDNTLNSLAVETHDTMEKEIKTEMSSPIDAKTFGSISSSTRSITDLAPETIRKRHRYRQQILLPKLNAIFRAAGIDEVDPAKFTWKGVDERLKDVEQITAEQRADWLFDWDEGYVDWAESEDLVAAAIPEKAQVKTTAPALVEDNADEDTKLTKTPKSKIIVLRTHKGYDPNDPDAELDHTQLQHYKGFTWCFTPISTLSERRAIHDPLREYIQKVSAKKIVPIHQKAGMYEQFCLSTLSAADGGVVAAYGDGDARSKAVAHGYWDQKMVGKKKKGAGNAGGSKKQGGEEGGMKWFWDGDYGFNDLGEVVRGYDGMVVGVVLEGQDAVLLEEGGLRIPAEGVEGSDEDEDGDGHESEGGGSYGDEDEDEGDHAGIGGPTRRTPATRVEGRKRKRSAFDEDDEDADYVDEDEENADCVDEDDENADCVDEDDENADYVDEE